MKSTVDSQSLTEPAPGPWNRWALVLNKREEHVFLALTLLIGALSGLAVVAFIVVTGSTISTSDTVLKPPFSFHC